MLGGAKAQESRRVKDDMFRKEASSPERLL